MQPNEVADRLGIHQNTISSLRRYRQNGNTRDSQEDRECGHFDKIPIFALHICEIVFSLKHLRLGTFQGFVQLVRGQCRIAYASLICLQHLAVCLNVTVMLGFLRANNISDTLKDIGVIYRCVPNQS